MPDYSTPINSLSPISNNDINSPSRILKFNDLNLDDYGYSSDNSHHEAFFGDTINNHSVLISTQKGYTTLYPKIICDVDKG